MSPWWAAYGEKPVAARHSSALHVMHVTEQAASNMPRQTFVQPSASFTNFTHALSNFLLDVPGLRAALTIIHGIAYHLLISPLETLYFYGPSFMGVGFWGGASNDVICADIVNRVVESSHWRTSQENIDECQRIVNGKFRTFLVTWVSILYLIVLIIVARKLMRKCC